ncbi:hypothetical protein M2138_000757 [Dysgonomonadaceae bacterium PH5-43]|nr:hypothetical protein [Dysgonomonadaceae bacterium PH5-43]
MSTNILFVFEGIKTEKQIVDNLQKEFFVPDNTVVTCVYSGEIYQIYRDIEADEDLDTFNLLKERTQNADILKNYRRTDFAEIYMFFDYDGHSTVADDDKLNKLLNFFNEETDKGKLYISYPMVESLKHIDCYNSFKYLNVECKENINYKNLVHSTCMKELSNFTLYNTEVWKRLIYVHLKKMNYIVFDSFEFPEDIITQSLIFTNQLSKFINREPPMVAVLSAFPIFIHDYYGNDKTKELCFICDTTW